MLFSAGKCQFWISRLLSAARGTIDAVFGTVPNLFPGCRPKQAVANIFPDSSYIKAGYGAHICYTLSRTK